MFIELLIKGFLIGFAFIVPGLSGGTLAVYFGIYDKLLHAIGNIFKEFKQSIKFLLPLFIGIAMSVVVLAKLFAILLDWNSFIVLLFFIGLMLGGLKGLYNEIDDKKPNLANILSFVIAFSLVIILVIFEKTNNSNAMSIIPIDLGNLILIFLVGMAASMTMIVPGISGSALLLVLGYYTAIVSNVVGNIFDLSNIVYNLEVLIPFLLGAAVGVILFSRVIEHCLERFKSQSYFAILGFILASCIAIFFEIRDPATASILEEQIPIYKDLLKYLGDNLLTVFFGLITLVLGFMTSRFLVNKEFKGKQEV